METQLPVAFVTGVSGGIGKALVEALLQHDYLVFGIGRGNAINRENYHFIPLDLRNAEKVNHFDFPHVQAPSYLLVNNAGMIGEILPVGELSAAHFSEVMQVNAVAPQVLTNTFIQMFSRQEVPLQVVNISSGAGKRPIDAWASYCASKAALDRFSETVKQEMESRNHVRFFIHAIEPGVVDTNMQMQIRKASPQKFKASQRFHDLKNNNELITPQRVASKLMELIADPAKHKACLLSLSDI